MAPLAPPDRQGDRPLSLRVVAGHVHGGRSRASPPRPRPRLAVDRRREARQDHGRRGRRQHLRHRADRRSPRSSASTRCVTTCCARRPSATTASSPSRASPRATTPTSRTTSATSSRAWQPSWLRSAPASGRARSGDSALRASAEDGDRRRERSVGALRAPAGARGDLGAHRGDQRVPRAPRALEDGAWSRRRRGDG